MNSHFDQLMEERRCVMVENNESRRLPKLPKDTCDFLKESRLLTQKNSDLREERASLKFNSENLNIQYQKRLKGVFPRAAMDHHSHGPTILSIFGANANASRANSNASIYAAIPLRKSESKKDLCSTFVPYLIQNTLVEQQLTQHVSPIVDVCNQFTLLGKQDSTNKSYREIRNPSGPKNYEETVLVDAIKLLKNLTSQL
jgi:hypothetical protein